VNAIFPLEASKIFKSQKAKVFSRKPKSLTLFKFIRSRDSKTRTNLKMADISRSEEAEDVQPAGPTVVLAPLDPSSAPDTVSRSA
jgi:hypothetical protein